MKKFLQTLYPEEFVSKKNGNLLVKNIAKYGISKREHEIILLILEGLSNKEIEDKLFISLATVKDHIYNTYKKTSVKNRVQLVNLFSMKNSNN